VKTGNGGTQVAKLTASDGVAQDQFGYSVSISGNVIVVGAPDHAVGANQYQGATYIFVEPSGGWMDMTETAELTASDGVANGQLGRSLGISGNTVVAGAPYETVGANSEQGAVYLFVQPQNGWHNMTQTAKLTASNGTADGDLGFSVSISANTIVAGAPGARGSHGAGYIFVEPKGGWANMTSTAELTASIQYGFQAVAIDGSTIVAGAPYTPGQGTRFGEALVYVKPSTGWRSTSTPNAILTASDAGYGDELGWSVSVSGNVVVAGAPFADSDTGAAYVFIEPASAWANMTETSEIKGQPSDGLGASVANLGTTVLAGASGDNNDQGAAYAFTYVSNSGFTAFIVPGSTATNATGVNNHGEIVGTYSASGCGCGFLDANGTFTTLKYPGADSTSVQKINNSDEIVGTYLAASSYYGFTEKGGVYNTLEYPGAVQTNAFGLDGLGDVVGGYADANGKGHGYLYGAGVYTTIDDPGASVTQLTDVNDSGQITGYSCSSRCQSFVYQNGVFAQMSYPHAYETIVNGINNNGDLTGYWTTSGGVAGGFVYFNSTGEFVGFNIGNVGDDAEGYGIDDSDKIAGYFRSGNTTYGFYGHLPGH
jgi:hypothetical protein